MGQKQSTEFDKYQLNFLLKKENKFINTKPFKINKAMNTYYIYFKIDDYTLNHIINCEIELYISNLNKQTTSNLISEDVLKTVVNSKTELNKINKDQFYDIIHITDNSKKIIFRTKDVTVKSFQIIYVL